LPVTTGIIVRDIGGGIVESVLQLDVHSHTELLDVECSLLPVDTNLLAYTSRLICGELLLLSHHSAIPS
jgi:hypothetical protein